ncbi:MAG TPA: hypothetical protein VK427_22755 [Kofleriaceae bacterium]|nr:hypothetical protein [Kofleriaceae bacterium]
MRRALVAVALVACKEDAPTGPCERGAQLAVHEVDNDSAYMKALYAHVGSDRGAPQDPAARAAGVHAEDEEWQPRTPTDMDDLPLEPGPRQTDYYLFAHDRDALHRYLAASPAPPADRTIAFEYVRPIDERGRPLWRTHYLVKQPALDTAALADVLQREDQNTGRPVLMAKLTPAARETFRALTARSSKSAKKIAIVVDGEVTSAPIVRSEIPGGRIQITNAAEQVAALAPKLACVTSPAR